MKIPSSEHVETMFCTQIGSELAIFVYRTCNSMNNLSSYCGLVDAKIRASEKDLPVPVRFASACKNSGLILLTVMDSF